ncbi:hypothetical protein K457DRAFT_127366 [Linnemannia elongata AG-77]|uniref:Uncharacterized protein n=1 Tax=Linnemannia elongata AG-77 TaxID=1314771 RepID=A0A197JQG3_9FUNG|nr:hypothetical protein K457DRAFT_127366 [Linnemannia elongata AG-77]
MGTAGQAVTIDLVNGPSIAVRFVASLGTLNCSGSITTLTLTVPSNVAPGEYSLRIDTTPTIYSSIFQIDGPQTSTITPRATTTGLTPTGPETTKPNTSDSNVSPGLIGGIVAGVVVVVVIIAFFVRRNRRGEKGSRGNEDQIKGQPEMEVKSSALPPSHMDTQPQSFNQNAVQGHQHYTQPQGVIRDGVQELQHQNTFQFYNHPRPNVVTTASSNDYRNPQQPSIAWEPKPFVPSPSSRVQSASFSQPSDPQALLQRSHPQASLHTSYPQALPSSSDPHN